MRYLLVLVLACGATEATSSESATGSEQQPQPTSVEPVETEDDAVVPTTVTCNRECMPDETPCGRWVGSDPMEWRECPLECCDPSNPVSAKPVRLHELVRAVERNDAPDTIRALGRFRISPRCGDVEWESLPNERERGTCPAGWIILGEARAELSLEITRVAANTDASSAVLHLRAETPGDAWVDAMRAEVREAWNQILGEMAVAEEMRPDQEIFELGRARMTLSQEGARLTRMTRNLPR